jgi:glycosyltransferase involved in cell wall biosynthesis
MRVSFIVPAFNEAATIQQLLERVDALELQKQIVVVDDGSTDGTAEIAERFRGDRSDIVVLRKENGGKGSAVRAAIPHLEGEVTVIQDADLEYDPEDWPKLLSPVLKGRASVVSGSRFTGERRNMLILHWMGNRFLSLVTNVLYNSTLSDMETCYKLFDRTVLDGITLRAERFDFEPEVTAKVLRQGIRIYEVPISYTGRELFEGKKITWRDGFAALGTLIKYRFRD